MPAHAELLSITPANGEIVDTAPDAVVITYSESVSLTGGSARVLNDDAEVVSAQASVRNGTVTIPLDIGITDGLTCGRDDGSTVTTDYQGPFAFSGALEKVVVDVSGELIEDHDAKLRSTMAHQ